MCNDDLPKTSMHMQVENAVDVSVIAERLAVAVKGAEKLVCELYSLQAILSFLGVDSDGE